MESGHCRWSALKFKFNRCHHAKRRVTALAIVEDLEILEQRGGEFDPRVPPLAVQKLDLDATPERLDHGVVVTVTNRSHRRKEVRVEHAPCEGPGGELTGFNPSKQHRLVEPIVGVR